MIYLIIAISTIVFTIWTLFCGSIQVRCNDRDFNIEAKGWNDYTVEYSQIDSISYEENVLQNDNGYRTNGLGNLKYAMGTKTISSGIISATLMPPAIHMLS